MTYIAVPSHVQLFAAPWTVACQAPLSMEFFQEEYWSGLPFPPLKNLPNPGIKPTSLVSPALAGGFFTTSASWEALNYDSLKGKYALINTKWMSAAHFWSTLCFSFHCNWIQFSISWHFFKFIYWRIVASQSCASFCGTATWIRHMYTHTPSLLNFSPI